MRINRGANALFHFACAPVTKKPFTRIASKLSRLFFADEHRTTTEQCQWKEKAAVALASPSNENKMSDGGRNRAPHGVRGWKSS
jgi:hypothetical protein